MYTSGLFVCVCTFTPVFLTVCMYVSPIALLFTCWLFCLLDMQVGVDERWACCLLRPVGHFSFPYHYLESPYFIVHLCSLVIKLHTHTFRFTYFTQKKENPIIWIMKMIKKQHAWQQSKPKGCACLMLWQTGDHMTNVAFSCVLWFYSVSVGDHQGFRCTAAARACSFVLYFI